MKSLKSIFTLMYIGWVAFAVFWSFDKGPCPATHYIHHDQVITYAHLHNQYRFNPLFYSANILVLTMLFGGVLLFNIGRMWGRIWLIICLVILIPSTCSMTFVGLFCDFTLFTHIDTAAFDGHIYHLAYEKQHHWDTTPSELDRIYLYQCDTDGEQCQGRHIADTKGKDEAQESFGFFIDNKTNQLHVRVGSQTTYTINSSSD